MSASVVALAESKTAVSCVETDVQCVETKESHIEKVVIDDSKILPNAVVGQYDTSAVRFAILGLVSYPHVFCFPFFAAVAAVAAESTITFSSSSSEKESSDESYKK